MSGCSSIEDEYKSSIAKDVYNWFYAHRSIERNKDGSFKNDKEKKEAIEIRRIQEGLESDWDFKYEDLKLNEITLDGTIFVYEYIFKKDDTFRVFTETYYFDITSILPVPLKKEASEKIKNDISTLYEKFLWDGDFSDYMKYYFGLTLVADEEKLE